MGSCFQMETLDVANNEITQENMGKQEMLASPFLVPLFNFFYYLMLIPFKTVSSTTRGEYILKTNIPQQIICGMLHVIGFLILSLLALEGIFRIRSNDASSIVVFFDLGSNLGSLMAAFCMLRVLWRRRKDYLIVINITRCRFTSKRKLNAANLVIYIILGTLLLFFGVVDWFIIQKISLAKELHLEYIEALIQQMFTLNPDDNYSYVNNTFSNDSNQGDNFTLRKCFVYFSVLYMALFFNICQATFLALVLTFRKLGKEFSSDMLKECYQVEDGIAKGFSKYRNLKKTTSPVCQLFGNGLVGFYISAVAYYAEAPHILMGIRGEAERSIMIYFVISGVTWLIAAEFHYEVRDSVLKWVEYHTEQDGLGFDSRLKLHNIFNEVSLNDGISAHSKWFSVTYKHIGSMLGLVVTYGIIVFQLHPARQAEM